MVSKIKPLTDQQIAALKASEDTLYGDVKCAAGFGRSIPALRKRGLVEGEIPHVYLTDDGKVEKDRLHG